MRIVNSRVKHAVAVAGTSFLLAAITMPQASAASFDNGLKTTVPTILVSEDIGLHTRYPGSNSDAAKANRARRNAPHYICDKSPERCQ